MKLKEALGAKKFIVTSEVQAPLFDTQPEDLVECLKRVRGRVDGVSVSDVELEGVVGDTIHTCELLQLNRFNSIYQTTTRDKNRVQLQKDLTQAYQSGVENLLVFTEDYRISGDSLQETMFFHVDSGKLGSCWTISAKGARWKATICPTPWILRSAPGLNRCGVEIFPKKAWKRWKPCVSWAPATF